MTTYSPSARTSEGKAPTNSRMTSPPGVRTVKVVLARASPAGLLTSLSVSVAQRWRIVTSIRLPEVTLISAMTIELDGIAVGGTAGAQLTGICRALILARAPTMVSSDQTIRYEPSG